MARAHFVQRAAKDYPKHGIKKGESYWWWQFRSGGRGMGLIRSHPKQYSKTKPRASQLTQSPFLGQLYDIQDDIEKLAADDGLESAVQEIAGRLEELANEQTEKLENMPDGLKEGSTGQLLQERADACQNAADELSGMTLDDSDKEDDEPLDDYWQRKLDEVQAVSIDAS